MNAAAVKICSILFIQMKKKEKKNLMTKINHVCFDLDGTLVRSAKTIYKTTINTLNQIGINHHLPEAEFNKMIGQHFHDIFRHFAVDVPDFEYFIRIYKKNYFNFMDDSDLYDSVYETLSSLKSKNIKISLLTTKAQDQAEKIISHFKLDKYFDLIMGRRDGIPHKPSPEPLFFICNELKIKPSETLMVGDTELDIQCGKAAGSKTCGVTFGYRETEVLKTYNPDYLISSLSEINLLLS
jgi:HAD superfamily hydrolase (TIGR01549 family)